LCNPIQPLVISACRTGALYHRIRIAREANKVAIAFFSLFILFCIS
jgi:hypothetical protein